MVNNGDYIWLIPDGLIYWLLIVNITGYYMVNDG